MNEMMFSRFSIAFQDPSDPDFTWFFR